MINALKNPSFFRPLSRPASPAPPRSSPPSPPAPTPTTATTPLVQDGTYLELLSLKFSEAVSKSLAQPTTGPANPAELLSGKRPIPPGRGSALGALIASELTAARENPHLYRAIHRSLHRPLSVLVNNLSSILLPLLASPSFLNPAAPTIQAPNPNATQAHALAIAKFAEELLVVFDQLELVRHSDPRSDGLRSIREGLVSITHKVVTPLINGIRTQLVILVDALERPQTQVGSVLPGSSSAGTATNNNSGTSSVVIPTRPVAGTKTPVIVYHPSIVTMQAVLPVYARALARYTTSTNIQATLANLLISVLWKAMVALSNRPDVTSNGVSLYQAGVIASSGVAGIISQIGSNGSTTSTSSTSSSNNKKRRGDALSSTSPASATMASSASMSATTTPPATPPPSRFGIKLPPSRPPSPPTPRGVVANAAMDARAFWELITGGNGGVALPRPAEGGAPREAVDEAFEGFEALLKFLEVCASQNFGVELEKLRGGDRDKQFEAVVYRLSGLTRELPTLVALPILLKVFCAGSSIPTLPEMLGLGEEEYRKGCLSGFGRAEECATLVGSWVGRWFESGVSTASLTQKEREGRQVVKAWLDLELEDA